MDFEEWKRQLAAELDRTFWENEPGRGARYIAATGDECWREMFDDGFTPADAAGEESWASVQ